MEIRSLKKEDLDSLCEFCGRMFPERTNQRQIFEFWFGKSGDEISRSFVLADDNKIDGQLICSSFSYYWHNTKANGLWGFDLIVDPSRRKENYGIDLMVDVKAANKNVFATGSNDGALKLNFLLGYKLMGYVKKYVRIVNPLWFFSSLFRCAVPASKFPVKIQCGRRVFTRTEVVDMPSYEVPFNDDLLEIGRDKEFLNWRYGTSLHDYVIYLDEDAKSYFVVRTIIKAHMSALVLVDYRCDVNKGAEFCDILSGAKTVANRLRIPMLITGSSLSKIDSILEKKWFKSIGRPRPIISVLKCKEYTAEIEDRNFTLVTLADSDGEILW